MQTMADWFGLRDGRDDFTIQNFGDAELQFSRSELDTRLGRVLRHSFRSGIPPKLVLWGDWGVGKTHTLRHIMWTIGKEGYSARCVYVELPDLDKRSRFGVAHAAILDAIGLDVVRGWIQHFQAAHPTDAEEELHAFAASADIAKAFVTLLARGADVSRIAWDWLRGIKLGNPEARSAGLPPLLNQSQSMATVIRVLGRLARDIDEAMLVLLVDEADKLRGVEDHDAVNHWLNALRVLSDPLTREVGLIVAASFRDRNEFPPPLSDGQILSRVGEANYVELRSFDDTDVNDFIRQLFECFADPAKTASLATTHDAERNDETLQVFPMTEPARERFAQFACRDGGITTPRDVQRLLDEVLNQAIDDDRHILSSDYIEDLIAHYG